MAVVIIVVIVVLIGAVGWYMINRNPAPPPPQEAGIGGAGTMPAKIPGRAGTATGGSPQGFAPQRQ
jgi:hypothetical protein